MALPGARHGGQREPLGVPGVRGALVAHAKLRGVPVSLDLLCELAGSRWSDAGVGCSVPIRVVGAARAQTVAAADLARMGEELQVTVGEGPSLDVIDGAETVRLDDMGGEEPAGRWPMFAPAAVVAGIRSMVVFPMRVGAAQFGAFAVYLRTPGGLDPSAQAEALEFAPVALDLLLEYLVPHDSMAGLSDFASETAVGDSGAALDDRSEIHQATGMVSVQLGVDLPAALLRMRASAVSENRLMSHLAADVVSRAVRFDRSPPSGPDFRGAHGDG